MIQMFLKACIINISDCLTILNMFGDASDLQLNVQKSTLINVTAKDFQALVWPGKRVQIETVFRYLGYPLGVHVPNKELINWVMDRV